MKIAPWMIAILIISFGAGFALGTFIEWVAAN